MTEDVKTLDEIVTKMRDINKQTKHLKQLITQMSEHRNQLVATAIHYDHKVHDIYKIYTDIFDLITPVCDVFITSNQPSNLQDVFKKIKTLFQQARLQQYETQLILPLFELPTSN